MAVIGGLLLAMLVSTALGAIAAVAGLERRATAAHETRVQLKLAAEGALLLMARDIEGAGFRRALEGWGSGAWRKPVSPAIDINGLTAALRQQTMMASAHGADTPVWQVYVHAGWSDVAGAPSRIRFLGWVADDWEERDGDPRADSNGRVLLRVRLLAEPAGLSGEALAERGADGRVTLRHLRLW